MIQKMILELKSLLATLTSDPAKKAEIEAKITALEAEAAKQPAPQPASQKKDDTQPMTIPVEVIEGLRSEIEIFKQMLAKQEQRALDAEKSMADRIKSEKTQKLADYIKKVTEVENKITPAELKEKWQPLLEGNFEATCKIIDGMKPNPASKVPVIGKDGKSVETKVGIMKSAPSAILAKIQEYSTANQN